MGERLLDKRTLLFVIIAFACVGIVLTFIPMLVKKGIQHTGGHASWSADDQRAYANKLRAAGLATAAAKAYEEYLVLDPAASDVRANTYFMLGETYMNKGAYEEAAAYFYKAEIADRDGKLKQDIGINLVTCFEKLGKPLDAQSILDERVTLDHNEAVNARGAMVARIGGRVITMGEINDELADLPAWYQEKYKDDVTKADFIRQYVINKVLLKKGLMLQYDKDAEVREQLIKAEESLIIQKVVKENVMDGLSVDAMDLENYYQAHKGEFKEEVDGKEVSQAFEDVKEEVRQMFLSEKAEAKMKEFVGRLLQENDAVVFFEPPVAEQPKTDEAGDDTPDEVNDGGSIDEVDNGIGGRSAEQPAVAENAESPTE